VSAISFAASDRLGGDASGGWPIGAGISNTPIPLERRFGDPNHRPLGDVDVFHEIGNAGFDA
jgi:hypothetical protein